MGAVTVTLPAASTSSCWFVQRQSNSMRWPSACLARAVTVAVSVSPTRMVPPYWSCEATMAAPGPGSRRLSIPARIAAAAEPCVAGALAAARSSPRMWNDSTSPEASDSASTSVAVTVRVTVSLAPTSISSNVWLV